MNYYNEISDGYVELHKDEQLKKIELIKQNISINKDNLLLDLGCGPYFGDFFCKVIGLDPSIELLKQANIPVVCAKAEHLPFKDHVFDTVISVTAMHNFDDIERAIKEAIRVGKQQFAFTVLKKSKKLEEITNLLQKNFQINKVVDEQFDRIFLTTKYK